MWPGGVPSQDARNDDEERHRSAAPCTEYHSSISDFGMYRVYPVKPQRDPDEEDRNLEAYCDPVAFKLRPTPDTPLAPRGHEHNLADAALRSMRPPYAPFPNYTTFDMLYWQNNGVTTKSDQQINVLATQVMQQAEFDVQHLAHFDASRELKRLDDYVEEDESSPLSVKDGWFRGEVQVRVPKEGVRYASEEDAPLFTLTDVWHRKFADVIHSALKQECVKDWQMIPHKLFVTAADNAARFRDPHSPSPTPSSPSHSDSSSLRSSSPGSQSASSSSSSSSLSDPDREDVRVYSEVFNTEAALEEDAAMRAKPRIPGDPEDLEYCVTLIILYSDSTRLSNFGTASLWPMYMFFGNQSKYTRGRPTAYAAHHMAYIPSLPDRIQDFYTEHYDAAATAVVLTFLRRELMQQVLLLLLDDRFMYIYVHGEVVVCGDGVTRRQFPRFVLYIADYVEKILLACLKYLAKCPCPRCKINKDKIIEMGTRADDYRRNHTRVDDNDVLWRIKLARQWIFEKGMPLTSVYLQRILGPLSLTPTRSAFSIRLREHNFNFYTLFAPDFLHEVELGVWKSIFTHHMRILHAAGGDKIQKFNKRFRLVPTFGRSTIRKFSRNVCDQGKLAARDYEDRLQASTCCFMPVFEGLLDSKADNRIVLDLTFDLAMLLSLGKLRMHIPKTVSALGKAASDVGQSTRTYAKKVCPKYATRELPKELAARGRRKARTAKTSAAVPTVRKRQRFNHCTYKFHALRDYATTVIALGPLEISSAQTGEQEHIHVGADYSRTNKVRYTGQIARRQHRGEKMRTIKARVDAARAARDRNLAEVAAQTAESSTGLQHPQKKDLDIDHEAGRLPYTTASQRYHVANSQRRHDDILDWMSLYGDDPALTHFHMNLKDHLLARLQACGIFIPTDEPDETQLGEYAFEDRARLVIHKENAYWHEVLRLNWTSYDLRRCQDSVNPKNHGDIMLLADTTGDSDNHTHPYIYARVIRIFHVNVRLYDSPMQDFERMDVVFVRWFRVDHSAPGGFEHKRLHRLEFVPTRSGSDEHAFGFVNPSDVVRGCHIVPAYAYGRIDWLLGPSMAREVAGKSEKLSELHSDYRYHYVNFFVDRDMFMRYFGGGIGHRGQTARTVAALDDDEPGSDWADIISDASNGRNLGDEPAPDDYGDDDEVPAAIHNLDDLLQLVPEITEGGIEGALAQELAAFRANMDVDMDDENDYDDDEDRPRAEWELEDEDGRPEVLGLDSDVFGEGLDDEYDLVGFAAP
ncbi:hypothetical protein K466DRAFT_531692 [Polyporus arcularius HHB13444]|uniref:Uncharacterized protein n=1 Tax=Polyporus arcularius HHB13444 TaxID=1314778 RepID=A0A5C3NYA6_9APHY|nr:hypothetical protein K466DRAFT_531692 [Polyporus arcularius HHB13444]